MPDAPATADLSDAHPQAQTAEPVFRDYGGHPAFCGPAVTLRVFEDHGLVRDTLGTPGQGQVLVIDGGASLNCALLGDALGTLAVQNGWAGVIVNGCVRDTAVLKTLPVGVKALAAHPRRSGRTGEGERHISLMLAGVMIEPGDWVYADTDGILISTDDLRPAPQGTPSDATQ